MMAMSMACTDCDMSIKIKTSFVFVVADHFTTLTACKKVLAPKCELRTLCNLAQNCLQHGSTSQLSFTVYFDYLQLLAVLVAAGRLHAAQRSSEPAGGTSGLTHRRLEVLQAGSDKICAAGDLFAATSIVSSCKYVMGRDVLPCCQQFRAIRHSMLMRSSSTPPHPTHQRCVKTLKPGETVVSTT